MNLFFLNLKVGFLQWVENIRIALKYYGKKAYMKADLALFSLYFFENPFSISKRFHRLRQDPEVYVYGETPVTTFEKIAEEANIKHSDVVYELGSGRGRIAFWLSTYFQCKTVGIEEIPEFVLKANQVVEKQNIQNLSFICGNFLEADLSPGNVFYLYGTCLDDKTIEALAKKFKKGDKVISVSYPLTDYSNRFKIIKQFPAKFTWGYGDVTVQECVE